MTTQYHNSGKKFTVVLLDGSHLVFNAVYRKDTLSHKIYKDVEYATGSTETALKVADDLQKKGWVI